MSGNDSELPDGSTRLADREASEFQQRQQRQQQRQQAVEERRQQAAEQLGLERADIQPEFDDRGNVAELGVTPEGQAEVEADTREEIAGQSEFITPDDVSVEVSSAGVEEAAIAEDRRDDIAERVSEDVASDADFLEEQDVSVSVTDTGIENIDVDERAAVRRRATEQAIESDPFVDSADDVDVSVEETESGEFNVEAERAASAELAANAVENLSGVDFRLPVRGPPPSAVTLQDQFTQLRSEENVTAISTPGGFTLNFSGRTGISPTFEDGVGAAQFQRNLRALDADTRSELTIADLGQDPEFLQEGIEDVRRQTRRDAIQDELDEAGVDDLGASVSLDGDVVLQDEQNRTGSAGDLSGALEELRQNQLDSARFDAAQQIDSDTPGVDVRSSDLQRSGGEFSLDAETRQAVEAAQQEQARRDAADRFDSRLDGIDVGSDDVQLGEQGGETIAELDDATRDAVLEQQRTQARQDAAAQFDAQTGLDVGPGDVEVQQTDEGFEAALDDETEDELLERRQDIAAEITPDGSLAAADAEARFANLETRTPTVSDRLGVDRDAEPSRAANVAADIGQFLREDVLPAGGGAAIGAAASTFRGSFDPGREATDSAVERLEGPAEEIDDAAEAGIDISTDATSDVVAGATPLPEQAVDPAFDTIEGGAEIGAESLNPARIAQDTARAPGLTLRGVDAATGEQAAENIQFGADVTAAGAELAAEEGPEFVAENPRRSAEIGIGAGIALGGGALAGTAVTRGTTGAARGARSVLGEVDLDSGGRRLLDDERGQLDIGRSGEPRRDEAAVLEELGELDTAGTTSQADDDITVSADEVLGEFEEPDDVAVTATQERASAIAAQREGRDAAGQFGAGGFDDDIAVSEVLAESEDVGDVDVSTLRQRAASIQEQRRSQRVAEIREQQQQPSRDFGFEDDATPAVREATEPISRRQPQEFAAAGSSGAFGRSVGAGVGVTNAVEATQNAISSSPEPAAEQTTQPLNDELNVSGVGAAFAAGIEEPQAEATGQLDAQATVQAPDQALGLESQQRQLQAQTTVQEEIQQQQQQQTQLQTQLQTQQQTQLQQQAQLQEEITGLDITPRTRPNVPNPPEFGGEDDAVGTGLGAIGANFENPTRTLSEADDLVTEIGGEFDGPR